MSLFWSLEGPLNLEIKELSPSSTYNLSELINVYSTWNFQKTYGFLMISGRIEVK